MMLRNVFLAGLLVLAAVPARAQSQPIYESMCDCSAIYFVLSASAEERGKSMAKVEKLQRAGDQFFYAAYEMAATRGKPDGFIEDMVQQKVLRWNDKISSLVEWKDNKEWMKYCRALGRKQGLSVYDEK